MTSSRTVISAGFATVALGYLAIMVLTGAQPIQRQLVAFEAKGVLTTAPEHIRRVEVSRAAERVEVVRTGERTWKMADGPELDTEAAKRISMAVQMMHTSAPARVISAEELEGVDLAGFELDSPRLHASLYGSDQVPVLIVRFGGHNPDGFLQYMTKDGDPGVYLMSRFVGEEWVNAVERIVRR